MQDAERRRGWVLDQGALGKAERILQDEWGARPYRSNAERLRELPRWSATISDSTGPAAG